MYVFFVLEWSLSSLFGKAVRGVCPLASRTRINVSIEDSGIGLSVNPPPLRSAIDGWFTYDEADIAGG